MSHQAVEWALRQPISHAPAKQILTVMAHYAHKDQRPWTAFPSITQLAQDTGQDRKTVMVNLLRLVECGALRDTGERAGGTKSVVVYELCEPTSDTKTGTASRGRSSTKTATASDTQAVPKLVPLSGPETGTASTDGSSTSFSGSSTSFSGKQYQKPPEAVPVFPTEQVEQVVGTGIGTGNARRARARPIQPDLTGIDLPDWLPLDEWAMFDRFRRAKSARAWTEDAKRLALRTLGKLRDAGNAPAAVLAQSVERGWTGLFPLRDQHSRGVPSRLSRQEAAEAEHQRFLRLVGAPASADDGRTFDMGEHDATR